MKRTARDHRPYIRPVEKVELSEKNLKLRGIIAAILLVVGVVALVYAFITFLSPDSGWREIETSSSSEVDCAEEFVLLYDLGKCETAAPVEYKTIQALYTEAMKDASELFDADKKVKGLNNIYYINHHPNEVIEVNEALYHAFELLEQYNNRNIYLGPVYDDYDDLFICDGDSFTSEFDPYQNEELKERFAKYASFVNDKEQIDLELLGDGKVQLKISEEYLDYCKSNYVEKYIDLFWMKNAFMVDYISEALVKGGYTYGSLTSYDGFSRCMDDSDSLYSLQLFLRNGNDIFDAACMNYSKSCSIVSLRDYKVSDLDRLHYYEFKDGETRTSYLDTKDGLCKESVPNLYCYSKEKSCAEVVLEMIPLYISDNFDESLIVEMKNRGINSVYGEDYKIKTTDESIDLSDIYKKDGVSFEICLVQ